MNSAEERAKCVRGADISSISECPNMEYNEDRGGMEYELYECAVCGQRYKLYYEDMA